jgi:symplekin
MASRRDLLLPSNLPPEPDENDDDFSQSSDEDLAPLENDFFLTAMDDLEGRIVSALDTYKLHTGVRRQSSNNTATATTIHDELKEILRPVLEIAAHSGPALARRYASFRSSVDRAMEEVYTRLNSDLILPVLLECAQTDMIPAKRSAALNFFHDLYREYLSSGSFLADDISLYGAFSASSTSSSSQVPSAASTAAAHALASRQRANQRSFRTAELLRYWIEASSSCTVLGAFTDQKSDGAIASRAVVSAGAVIRPALKHIAEKISSADDAGAMKLYLPLMKMMGGVLRRLLSFDSSDATMAKREKMEDRMSMDALRSSCIKFLEIIVLSFATRLQPGTSRVKQRNMATVGDDFAIDDLPMGHPVITRGALEEIGEDSFTVLKGLLLVGGQIKTDSAVIRDVMLGLGMEASGMFKRTFVSYTFLC